MIIASIFLLITLSTITVLADIIEINVKYKKVIFGLLLGFASIIAMFRDGIGVDYDGYRMIYNLTPSIDSWVYEYDLLYSDYLLYLEMGYLVLNGLIKYIFNDYIFVFIIMAGLTMYVYYRTIPKYTPYIFSGWFIYFSTVFFYKEMGQIRHGLAMAIILYSLQYIYKNRLKKFIYLYVIAMLFHKAVALAILLYPLRKVNINVKKTLAMILVSIIVYTTNFLDQILSYLENTFFQYTRLMLLANEQGNIGDVGLEKFIFIIGVIIIGLCLKNKLENYKYYNIGMLMMLVGLMIMSIFHEYKEFGQRLSACFFLAEIFLLPTFFIGWQKNIINKYIGTILLSMLSIAYILHTMTALHI